MVFLLSLLLIQGVRTERIAEKPIDDAYSLVLMRTMSPSTYTQRLVLQDRINRSRYWNLEEYAGSVHYEFARTDRTSVVLFRGNDYGYGDYLKLFFDTGSKRVLKRIEFKETGLSQIPSADLQRRLTVTADFVAELKKNAPSVLPSACRLPALPQSTYAEFARARPERVRQGYDEGSQIEEKIGACAISQNTVWLGKKFYDGEGYTGVGAIGYFDRAANKYTFLKIAQVVDWSVSSLLVEGDLVWASLVRDSEGAEDSGGLLLHNVNTGTTRKYPVNDVVSRIIRRPDGLYLTTSNGVYVLKGEQMTRHRVEPDFNGKPAIYSEELP